MNEEEKLPFFLNTRRLQRADSYFEIGRTQEKLRRFLEERSNSDSVPISCSDSEENASVGFYGVQRYISLEPDPGDEDSFDKRFIKVDEDVDFENTSAFSLFWMTFKRIAHSIGDNFLSSSSNIPRGVSNDPEGNHEQKDHSEDLYKVLVDPTFRDPRIKQSKIVYGDLNYLIQKFRMDLKCGSLDIALFSVEFPSSQVENFDSTDLQAYVVSPECGSFVWIENGKASAIFMTQSSTDFFGNVMEWFRKILSDMALADSVMIGHPYYWHATVRRRLTKVMKYMKRLYRNLALKEKGQHNKTPQSERISSDAIEVVCPSEISKIVINEQPTENLLHTCCTYEQLNIMLEQLIKKWFDYQRNLKQSRRRTINDVSRTWSANSPQSLNREITDEGNFLESVTFLDFNVEDRESSIDGEIGHACNSSIVSSESCYNNNMQEASAEVPYRDSGQNITESFEIREGCYLPQEAEGYRREDPEDVCKLPNSSTKLPPDTSILIEDSEHNIANETFPQNEASMKYH